MKKPTLKSVSGVGLFLTACGYTCLAWADSQVGALGADPGAIDRYLVTCSANGSGETGRLEVRIRTISNSSPLVSVQAYQAPTATSPGTASNTTDPVGGDGSESAPAYIPGVDGDFYVTVDKSGSEAADYELNYQCQTVNGSASTGTAINLLQDQ